jgi:hypothetical protein
VASLTAGVLVDIRHFCVSEVNPTLIPLVLEAEVREGRKGLWADPQLVPPWKGRKRKER